ncbi:MAG: hypothetical protein QMD96_06185 [Anaerosomatales bacterium]|nr:hypothetical protein [Anaerosomatales bacterium]
MNGVCEFSSRCAVFAGRSVAPDAAFRYRDHFCTGDRRACARWALASAIGIERVPDDLLPQQHARADEFLIQVV